MFVRTLIGRQAGQIIELPYHAGSQAIDFGTAETVTDAEAAAAGFVVAPTGADAPVEDFPAGYWSEPIDGGFDVFLVGGDKPLNDHLIPNLPAARSFAIEHAAGKIKPVAPVARGTREPKAGDVTIPDGWKEMKFNDGLSTLAAAVSTTPIKSKADAFAAIEQELAWRAEDEAAKAAGAAS
jgi:hypothetical protein